jgi:hypothetical protein
MASVNEPHSSGHTTAAWTSPFGRLGYPATTDARDLRFDVLRGFAMLSVVAAHLEFFSWFNFLFWERLGFISAAELFVVASGLVLGQVNRRVADRSGLGEVTSRLLRRAFILWRALVVTVILIILIRAWGVLDLTMLTTFTDRFAGLSYPMVPPPEVPWHDQLALILSLRVSPHQIQILGLYVLLLLSAPLWFWLLHRRLLGPFFALTWGLYAAGWLRPLDTAILGMQWEFAFPFLIYQVLFTHALLVGYFRPEIAEGMAGTTTRGLFILLGVVPAVAFFVFAQMTPNPSFPSWSRLNLMDGAQWQAIYDTYFVKKRLGLPRLLNVAAFFLVLYALLSYAWVPIHRALGWLLIPLGEASLYVFLMHLVFIALIDQIPGYFDAVPDWHAVWPGRIWINTALYMGTILGLWALVRYRVLFGVVPR